MFTQSSQQTSSNLSHALHGARYVEPPFSGRLCFYWQSNDAQLRRPIYRSLLALNYQRVLAVAASWRRWGALVGLVRNLWKLVHPIHSTPLGVVTHHGQGHKVIYRPTVRHQMFHKCSVFHVEQEMMWKQAYVYLVHLYLLRSVELLSSFWFILPYERGLSRRLAV